MFPELKSWGRQKANNCPCRNLHVHSHCSWRMVHNFFVAFFIAWGSHSRWMSWNWSPLWIQILRMPCYGMELPKHYFPYWVNHAGQTMRSIFTGQGKIRAISLWQERLSCKSQQDVKSDTVIDQGVTGYGCLPWFKRVNLHSNTINGLNAGGNMCKRLNF